MVDETYIYTEEEVAVASQGVGYELYSAAAKRGRQQPVRSLEGSKSRNESEPSEQFTPGQQMQTVQKSAQGKEKKKCKVLVIGDSMLRRVVGMGEVEGWEVKCLPGIRIEHIKRQISGMEDQGFEVVMVNVGSNNMYGDVRDIRGKIWDMIVDVKQVFKEAKVIVNSIMLRCDVPNTKTVYINEEVDWMCKKMDCVYVDTNIGLVREDLGWDGVHPSWRGSCKFGEKIKGAIKGSMGN
jgi:hypothetical protein